MKKNNDIYDLLSTLASNLSSEELMFVDIASDLAAQIAARRIDLGLTQAELAEKMGKKQGTISKWESGDCNFQLKTLIEIAQKLDLPLTVSFKPAKPTAEVYWISSISEVMLTKKYATADVASFQYTQRSSSDEKWAVAPTTH